VVAPLAAAVGYARMAYSSIRTATRCGPTASGSNRDCSRKHGKPTEIGKEGYDALSRVIVEDENGILAMRATCATFLKEEQVGYVAGTDGNEEDMEPMLEDDGEAGTVIGSEKKAPVRRGKPVTTRTTTKHNPEAITQ